jgi:hypothetical protein
VHPPLSRSVQLCTYIHTAYHLLGIMLIHHHGAPTPAAIHCQHVSYLDTYVQLGVWGYMANRSLFHAEHSASYTAAYSSVGLR